MRESGSDKEVIQFEGRTLAILIRASYRVTATDCPTGADNSLQLCMFTLPAGHLVKPHVHLPLERHINDTQEFVLVRRGKAQLEFFSPDRQPIAERILNTGDMVLLIAGGHSFRMLEDTELVEVKQGPFFGTDVDKIRF